MSDLIIDCPLDTRPLEAVVLNGERIPLIDHATSIEFEIRPGDLPILKFSRSVRRPVQGRWVLP